ncbi:MAG: glycosyltransferase [Candidatus Binatia bacterium]
MKLAIVNELFEAGATRCARDLEAGLRGRHQVRYFPEARSDTVGTLLSGLREYDPHLVHCHSYYGQFPYHLLALISQRYPTCFTPHDPRPIGTFQDACWDCSRNRTCFDCPLLPSAIRYSGLLNRYFRMRSKKQIVHYLTHSSTQLIISSKWLEARLRNTELKRFRMHHVPYGIDAGKFHHVGGARRALGLPEDKKVVLHVAYEARPWNWNPRKGMNYLAEAFVKLVLARYPDALLMVAGEGLVPNHPAVRPMALVPNDRLSLYYSAADVFVAATVADNLPYTVLEAMACEIPVVASRVGGIPEEVADGETGLLVPPKDVAALGAAILAVLGDESRRAAMGRAGRVRVTTIFGMERFLACHEAVYRHMLHPKDGGCEDHALAADGIP